MTNDIPDKESLEFMLQQKEPTLSMMIPIVEQKIKEHKLNWKIDKYSIVLPNETIEYKYRLIEVGESTENWLNRFITQHPKMLQLKKDVITLSQIDDEVLIIGETGTGKEIIARALHGQKLGKFVAVNCSGIPDQLMESIMFGHVKGSFTGADTTRNGMMKQAENGTFFLDEIGELKIHLQGILLRALQERKIRKIGSEKDEDINCRVVCATNKNLRKMSSEGTFRLDLYARLSTFELDTLSLKEREIDLEPILMSLDGGAEFIKAFESTDRLTRELDLSFNVRSLQQHVKRFKVLGKLPE